MSLKVKQKLSTFLKLLFEPRVLKLLISFRSFGYLLETGWFNSFKKGKPVDREFKPLPWFTYPSIDFLKEKLKSSHTVLEFGSGNSTLFFAEVVKRVVSFEHNTEWYEKLLPKAPQNVELITASDGSSKEYLDGLKNLSEKFDLVIVDGLFRKACLSESLNLITDNGIIILDDSERNEYIDGIKFLLEKGMKRLDFSGIAPGVFFRKRTTFFYRERNVFNI